MKLHSAGPTSDDHLFIYLQLQGRLKQGKEAHIVADGMQYKELQFDDLSSAFRFGLNVARPPVCFSPMCTQHRTISIRPSMNINKNTAWFSTMKLTSFYTNNQTFIKCPTSMYFAVVYSHVWRQ